MEASAISRAILRLTAFLLLAGLLIWAHWMISGSFSWVRWYFDYPVELFLLCTPLAQLVATRMVSREFMPGEPIQLAWRAATCSAWMQLAGNLVLHGIATQAEWSPARAIGASQADMESLRKLGMFIAGPAALLVLGMALHSMWDLTRRCGISARWRACDVMVVGVGVLSLMRHVWVVKSLSMSGASADWLTAINWASDPVLLYVLVIVTRLLESARELAGGLVAKCWRAYAVGVMLAFLGDLGLSLTVDNPGIWPWNSLFWYVWIPAAGAFAVAPLQYWAALSEASQLAGSVESRTGVGSPIARV